MQNRMETGVEAACGVQVVDTFRQSMLGSLRYMFALFPVRGRFRLAGAVAHALIPSGKVLMGHVAGGGEMVFDFRNPHEISMYFDLFAPELTRVLKRILRRGDVLVDCGANIGYFSCLGASLVGSTGTVYAIDANPFCTQRIEESKVLGRHSNIVVVQSAIGSHQGSIEFNIADDPMYSSVANLNELDFTKISSTVNMPLRTFDDVLASHLESGQRIRLIKIDIEGAEIDALVGSKEVLASRLVDYIYVEVHHKQLGLRSQNPADVSSILSSQQYVVEQKFGNYAYLYRFKE